MIAQKDLFDMSIIFFLIPKQIFKSFKKKKMKNWKACLNNKQR